MKPELILINPWIFDFAAYDLWSKPLGLLWIAAYLKECGFKIHLIDCLDIHHPGMGMNSPANPPVRRSFGTGKFWKKNIPKPDLLKHIPRPYNRYGITKRIFIDELNQISKPKAILVTSLMTYWYPGVMEVIKSAKEVHPDSPVILGGIYAKLCSEHAVKYSGADHVAPRSRMHGFEQVLDCLKRFDIEPPRLYSSQRRMPYPAFDMLRKLDYVCILTTTGCPYRCKYCASHFLNPKFIQREPLETIEEIVYWHRVHNVRDFAFYDDALLVNSSGHIELILKEIIKKRLNIRFHTPNALHVREISYDIAKLLYSSGFRTIRLGLETSDMAHHKILDNKVSEGEFESAVRNLKRAGFTEKEIGVYVLIGLPGQSVDSVLETLELVRATGAAPYLAEYSPIPHTAIWEKAVSHSQYDLVSEPLFHNNSLLPCWDEDQRRAMPKLKSMVREIRKDQD